MSDFSDRVEAFLAEFFRLNPTFATAIGEHRYDDRWPDVTDAGRKARGIDARRGKGLQRRKPRRGEPPRVRSPFAAPDGDQGRGA